MNEIAPLVELVRQVRAEYTKNPCFGLCCWFDAFDDHVAKQEYDICEGLLKEIETQGYPLYPHERRFVQSRQGVLLFCRGLEFHQNGSLDEAHRCYQSSLEIQNKVGCTAAAGQIEQAIGYLESAASRRGHDRGLAELQRKLSVAGGSAAMLCQRFERVDPGDRPQIILAAVQARLTKPLFQTLEGQDPNARMMAAAALGRFAEVNPAPLLEALEDPQWFVRWRAAAILRTLAEQNQIATESVPRILAVAWRETDPEVRRALADCLGECAGRRATPVLAAMLADPDPDVRYAASGALRRVGDRRALGPLRETADGDTLLSGSVRGATGDAIRDIQRRCPPVKVLEFQTVRLTGAPHAVEPAKFFWLHGSVFCLARIAHLAPDERLELVCTDSVGTAFFRREGSLEELLAQRPAGFPLAQDEEPDESALVQLVEADPDDDFFDTTLSFHSDSGITLETPEPSTGELSAEESPLSDPFAMPGTGPSRPPVVRADTLCFEIFPPLNADPAPGQWALALFLFDDYCRSQEQIARVEFTVVAQVKILDTVVALGIDSSGRPIEETSIVPPESDVYCFARLSEAPRGVKGIVELQGPGGDVLQKQSIQSQDEGEHYVVFQCRPRHWEPGTYRVLFSLMDASVQEEAKFQVHEAACR